MSDTKRTKTALKALGSAGVLDSWSYQDQLDLIETAIPDSGTTLPTGGLAAPLGFIYVKTDDETAWIKTGLADVDWKQIA